MPETQESADDQFRKYFADAYFGLCRDCKRAGVCGPEFCSFYYRPLGYIEAYSQEEKRTARKCRERNSKQ